MTSPPIDPRRPPEFFLSGARIHAVDMEGAVSVLLDWIERRHRGYVLLTGGHGLVEMQSDPELLAINNAADLVTPDGMPVVWMGWLKGHPGTRKVSSGITEATIRAGLSSGVRHYFYGGTEGVAERLTQILRERYPEIRIAGYQTPPFRPLTDEEGEAVCEEINRSQADIVWVGLGCPKQDRWMSRFRSQLEAAALVGVGASFDFLSGVKPAAPPWIANSGFEWLYRLLSEPRRLWPRYSRVVPLFLYHATRDLLGLGPPPPTD